MTDTSPPITAAQSRAGRALVGWSVPALAEATAMPVNQIEQFEAETLDPDVECQRAIRTEPVRARPGRAPLTLGISNDLFYQTLAELRSPDSLLDQDPAGSRAGLTTQRERAAGDHVGGGV